MAVDPVRPAHRAARGEGKCSDQKRFDDGCGCFVAVAGLRSYLEPALVRLHDPAIAVEATGWKARRKLFATRHGFAAVVPGTSLSYTLLPSRAAWLTNSSAVKVPSICGMAASTDAF